MKLSSLSSLLLVAGLLFLGLAAAEEPMTEAQYENANALPVHFESRQVDRLAALLELSPSDRVAREILEAIRGRKADTLYSLTQCPICLQCMHAKTLEETKCGHAMHHDCLTLSLRSTADACPICREPRPRAEVSALTRLANLLLPSVLTDSPLKRTLALFEQEGWIPAGPATAPTSTSSALFPSSTGPSAPAVPTAPSSPSSSAPSAPPVPDADPAVPPRAAFADFVADRIIAHVDLAETVLRDVADALASLPDEPPANPAPPRASSSGAFPPRPVLSSLWAAAFRPGRLDRPPRDCLAWLTDNVPGFADVRKLDAVPPKNVLCALVPLRDSTPRDAFRARARFLEWVLTTMRGRAVAAVYRPASRDALPDVADYAARVADLKRPPAGGWLDAFSFFRVFGEPAPAAAARAADPWLTSLTRVLCDDLRGQLHAFRLPGIPDEPRSKRPTPRDSRTMVSSSQWLQRVDDLAELVRTLVYSTVSEYSFPIYKYNDHLAQLRAVLGDSSPRSNDKFRANYAASPDSPYRKIVSVENSHEEDLA